MSFLLLYSIFALATAFMACIDILYHVMQLRKSKGYEIENETTHYVSFFFTVLLIAPVVFLSCFIPSWNIRFKSTLYVSIFPVDTKI